MKKENNTDYSRYVLNKKEYFLYGGIFVMAVALALNLLFGLWWLGLVLGAGLLPVFYRKLSAYFRDRRIAALEEEFCMYMQLTAASLAGGTSFENVFREVADSVSVPGEESVMKKEYYTIDRLIRLHYDSREAFAKFAARSGSKDIKSIAAALSCTADSGGNIVNLLRSGVGALRLKQDAEREIRRIISLPRMNHRIMTAMPFAFILLLKTMSPAYVNFLYVWPGQIVMFVVAALIVGAWILGEKWVKRGSETMKKRDNYAVYEKRYVCFHVRKTTGRDCYEKEIRKEEDVVSVNTDGYDIGHRRRYRRLRNRRSGGVVMGHYMAGS